MNNYIPTFTDISNWSINPYSSTGGTRSKKIYVNPENDKNYFFKGSKETKEGSIRYPLEFWSEIIASKIGQWFGFDLLDYNIAYDKSSKQPLGCLSKSMIKNSTDTLTEGIEYLRGYDANYNPNTDENRYTLDFIIDSLDTFQLKDAENKIIEMMIFDALIGNSDRHQENWGFITLYQEKLDELNRKINSENDVINKIKAKFHHFFMKLIHQLRKFDEERENGIKRNTLLNQSNFANSLFSPIYDSGCCLGRELDDDKIIGYNSSSELLGKYASKGLSEIRLENGKKPKHFDVLFKIKELYPEIFNSIQDRIKINFNLNDLTLLIQNIDRELPDHLNSSKLPDIRKKFIINLVSLRVVRILHL